MIHEINLDVIKENIKLIDQARTFYNSSDHLEDTLRRKIEIAKRKLSALQVRRKKRALINMLGTAIKYIAGNPDNEDLELIDKSLKELESNQEKQININSLYQDRINKITVSLKLIDLELAMKNNQTSKNTMDLEFVNLIFNTDNIVKLLEDIEEQVAFAKMNLLNKNILSDPEKILIFNQLREQGMKIELLDEALQYATTSLSFGNNRIILLIKIPKLHEEPFDLLRLETVNFNGSTLNTNIHLVAKNHDEIFAQNNICELCESTAPVTDECIFNMLTHRTAECKFSKGKTPTRIVEIKQGIVLIDTVEEVTIKDSCNGEKTINRPTIIEITNCTVTIRNQTFSNVPQKIFELEYLAPIYTKVVNRIETPTLAQEIQQLNIENLQQINHIRSTLSKTHQTIGYGLIGIVITILSCIAIKFIMNRTKRESNETTLQITGSQEESCFSQPTTVPLKNLQIPRFALHTSRSRTTDQS